MKKDCEIDKYSQRHSRGCKYYREYQRCKFGAFCFYRHEEGLNNNENLKDFIERTTMLENKVTCLTEQLDVKSIEVENLGLKLITLEKVLIQSGDQIKQINSLKENIEQLNGKVKEVEQNNYILMHAVDDVEKETKVIQTKLDVISHQEYACNFCDLVYPNEDQLQNHTRKDHGIACKKR